MGENQVLSLGYIDFKKKLSTINKFMYYKNMKEFYIIKIKTSASNRIIALDDKTVDNLKQRKCVQNNNCSPNYVLSHNGISIYKYVPKYTIDNNYRVKGVHRIKGHGLRILMHLC